MFHALRLPIASIKKRRAGGCCCGVSDTPAWSVLAAFVADVALHLRAGWRLGLLLAMSGAAAALLGVAWRVAFVRRNRLEHIARFLETRAPALGSRLINLLQLQDQIADLRWRPSRAAWRNRPLKAMRPS